MTERELGELGLAVTIAPAIARLARTAKIARIETSAAFGQRHDVIDACCDQRAAVEAKLTHTTVALEHAKACGTTLRVVGATAHAGTRFCLAVGKK